MCLRCFFFQAEDGIRDLVRSRGPGDVYKRQALGAAEIAPGDVWAALFRFDPASTDHLIIRTLRAVSYTHLTLPTSDLV